MSDGRLRGEELLRALEAGTVRAAERSSDGRWLVHAWVKEEILELFRRSPAVVHGDPQLNPLGTFVDKAPLSVRRFSPEDGVRVVPGGSSVRRGAYLAPGVVCMPPMYVNVGAYVGAGSMIDSHALIGSCAQVGNRVHVSAGSQIGGVLEPAGALPVIVEDDVLVGGLCGLFEGVIVRRGAVLAAGTVLSSSTPVYDLARECELVRTDGGSLEIPENAVVVPGARPARGAWAKERGLSAACALIAKYRDERTASKTAREEALH